MEYSPVHEVVAKWIASLPNISHANRENLAIYIASRGLTVLKVAQLKMVWNALRELDFVENEHLLPRKSLPNGIRKADGIVRLLRVFYEDHAFTQVRPNAIPELQAQTQVNMSNLPQFAPAGIPAAAAPGVSRSTVAVQQPRPAEHDYNAAMRQRLQQDLERYPALHMQRSQTPGRPRPSAALANVNLFGRRDTPHPHERSRNLLAHNAGSTRPGNATHAAPQPALQATAPQPGVSTASVNGINSAPNTSSATGSKRPMNKQPTISRPAKVIKQESNPDVTPQNATEQQLMATMINQGFLNKREILVSIRKLMPKHPTLDSKTVMCDIVEMREESHFARQMDMARLQSEQQRKEDAQRRRHILEQEYEETVRKATVQEWEGMFEGSWILRSELQPVLQTFITAGTSPLKLQVISLLKIEKQCRKWYGRTLPKDYFLALVARLKPLNATEMTTQLAAELKTLEHATFTLSEQKGGVPRIFLDAHDAAGHENEDVEVVKTASPTDSESSFRSRPSVQPPQPSLIENRPEILHQEIIEIL